jgi:glycerol-3-phosphate acyltransferase PlsY
MDEVINNTNQRSAESMKKRAEIVFAVIAVLGISFFPILFLYFRNSGEARFLQTLIPMLLVAGISIILWLAITFLMKSFSKASIITVLISLVLLNYALIEKAIKILFDALRYWHIVPILIYGIIYIGIFVKSS